MGAFDERHPWQHAVDRAKAIQDAADHGCFHTSDVLSPDAMRRAREIALAAPPLSSEQIEKLRPLLRPSPQFVAERDRRLSPRDAATAIGYDRQTVVALIEAGELIAERGPRRGWVVPNWSVSAYVKATEKTFCVDCHGSVDGKLDSRWLKPKPVKRRRRARTSTSSEVALPGPP